MAEKISITPETASAERQSEGERKVEKHRGAAEVESQKQKIERLEHIRGQIEHEAKTTKEDLKPLEGRKNKENDEALPPPNKELRKISKSKELSHIRSKLSAPDKLGSKIIHNPVIRNISEVSSKTISRPSGLLGGGIVAFLGSAAYYYLTEHIGLQYNYLLFAIFFVGGFIVGLIIELGIHTLNSRKPAKQ